MTNPTTVLECFKLAGFTMDGQESDGPMIQSMSQLVKIQKVSIIRQVSAPTDPTLAPYFTPHCPLSKKIRPQKLHGMNVNSCVEDITHTLKPAESVGRKWRLSHFILKTLIHSSYTPKVRVSIKLQG